MNEINVKKILESMLPDLYDIYGEYKYLNMTLNDFMEFIIKEIRINMPYCDDESFKEFIISEIRKILDKKTKELLKDDKTMLNTIYDYCNTLNVFNNYDDNLEELKKLCNLLEINDVSLDIDLILNILNNNQIVYDLVKEIVDHNLLNIQEGKVEYLFNKGVLTSLINAYCMLNEIEIAGYNSDNSYDENYYTNSLKTYLFDISQRSLLTKEEEIEYARKVQAGDIDAKNKFIESNLRLVVSIAKNYYSNKVQFLDLIQEGNIGLMTAIEKFNPELDIRLSTYAKFWIKREITRAIDTAKLPVKVASPMQEKIRIYKKKLREVLKTIDHTPTIYELSELLKIPIQDIEQYQSLISLPISLNEPIGTEDECELGNIIAKEDVDFDKNIFKENMLDDIYQALEFANLTERERTILIYRYGLGGVKIKTYSELANIYNVSHQRIKEIEVISLDKIKKSEKAVQLLAEYSYNPKQDYKKLEHFYKKKEKAYYKIKQHK